jgi:type II secretory pathway component GspD/PulD (secretin)
MLRINGVHPKAIANFINYLVSTGKAKVLSRPKIVATNGEIARIANEDTITYSAYTGPSEIMQKKTNTGLVLQIKPIIGSDTITLEIEAAIKSLLGFGEDGSPIINTRTTTSNVVLADGEVFTLSGLRKDTVTKSNSGVPVLQSIPLLGYFFRHEVDVHSKKELIVFLRPVKVRPETGLSKRESELLSAADEEMDAPPPSGVQKFVDRVIINRLD